MLVIFYRQFFLLILLLGHVRSVEVKFQKFNVTKVTQLNYGLPLDQIYIDGVTPCLFKCLREDVCQSVLYDETARLCYRNKRAVPPTSLMTSSDPNDPQYQYIGKVEYTSTMRQNCTQNSDCLDINSECRDKICKCFYGYSFDKATSACVTCCTSYGTTFQEELSRMLVDYDRQPQHTTTESDCRRSCLQATGFTCRSYNIYMPNTCFFTYCYGYNGIIPN